MKGTTTFTGDGGGDALYRLRDELEERPRCARCGAKLLLVRVKAGMSTCYRCDETYGDPELPELEKARRAEAAERLKRIRKSHFPGPPAPNGPGRIKEARLAASLTQRELGESIGVSSHVVGAWERGKNSSSAAALRAIERACEEALMARAAREALVQMQMGRKA